MPDSLTAACSAAEVGARAEFLLRRAGGVVVPAAPGQPQVGEAHAPAAARAAAAERVVFEQPQAFQHAREQRRVLLAEHVHHHAHAETRAGRHALERARVGLRGDAVDGVLALDLGQLVVEVLAHLRR